MSYFLGFDNEARVTNAWVHSLA